MQVLKAIFKSVTSLEVTNSLEGNIFFICLHTGLVMDCPKAAATGSQSPEIRYHILNSDFFFLSKTHPSFRLKFQLCHLHHNVMLYEASRDHRRTCGFIRVGNMKILETDFTCFHFTIWLQGTGGNFTTTDLHQLFRFTADLATV